MAGDLELGDAAAERAYQDSVANEKNDDLDEYSALVRYISTYRDPKAAGADVEDEEEEKKKPWYKRKKAKKGPIGAFETPAEWLETDLATGLSSVEVENRRKKTGWNELSAEKENMLLKFIGFFQGPVLYGMLSSLVTFLIRIVD
jgi:H+-transporting ATPase